MTGFHGSVINTPYQNLPSNVFRGTVVNTPFVVNTPYQETPYQNSPYQDSPYQATPLLSYGDSESRESDPTTTHDYDAAQSNQSPQSKGAHSNQSPQSNLTTLVYDAAVLHAAVALSNDPVKSTPVKSTPVKSTPVKSTPVKSIPWTTTPIRPSSSSLMHRAWMAVTSPFVTRLHPTTTTTNNHHHHINSNNNTAIGDYKGSGSGTGSGLWYEEEETLSSTDNRGSDSVNVSPASRFGLVLRSRSVSRAESESGSGPGPGQGPGPGPGPGQGQRSRSELDGIPTTPESPSFRESLRYFQQKIDTITTRQTLSTASISNVKPWEQVVRTSMIRDYVMLRVFGLPSCIQFYQLNPCISLIYFTLLTMFVLSRPVDQVTILT